MARVKQEVIEQRAKKRHPSHHQPPPAPPMPPSTGVSPPVGPPKPTLKVFSSGCIDLTLDDDTEDEEEKDEPLGHYVPPPHASPVDLVAEDKDEEIEEKAYDRAEEEEQPPAAEDHDQDTDTDVEAMAVVEEERASPVQRSPAKPTASLRRFSLSDVESDEDDELPIRSTTEEHEERTEDQDMEEEQATVATGIRSVVGKVGTALSYFLPSFGSQHEGEVENDAVEVIEGEQTHDEQDDEIEEEEDEALPAVYEPPSTEHPVRPQSSASDSGSTMEIDDDGDQTKPGDAAGGVAVVGGSLEDGEIFEEGAVAKSPSEVKQAIEQELLAAKGAKKRPKKRGRKKNKRKAEALEPVKTVDEFGRNVRPHVDAPPPPPADQGPQWMSPAKFSTSSVAGSSASASPSGSASPPPARLQTPPHPTLVHPPLPRMPPPPRNNFPLSHGPTPVYSDEHIVRVNSHGSVEPFNNHHGRPPLPRFPPMSLPPPPSVNGGFRYVRVDAFQPPPVPDVRGFKRPLPPFMRDDDEDEDTRVMDLDSLRAAALRTKRKTSDNHGSTEQAKEGRGPGELPTQSPRPEESEQKEEETSLDALRAELLKSMRPRKRLISNNQPTTESSTTPPEEAKDTGNNSTETSKPTTPSQPQKSAAASVIQPEPAPPPPESPMFGPLTVASQSIVIRLSLDDLHSKKRSDSLDGENAVARYGRVVDEVRAKAATNGFPPKNVAMKDNGAVKRTSPVKKSSPSSTNARKSNSSSPQKLSQTPPVAANVESKIEEKKPAPKAAEPPKNSLSAKVSNAVDAKPVSVPAVPVKPVDDELLRDPVRLAAEREACLASIREADAQLSRLDAEIAALRQVLVANEEAAVCAAATSPSIPAAKMAVEI